MEKRAEKNWTTKDSVSLLLEKKKYIVPIIYLSPVVKMESNCICIGKYSYGNDTLP